MSVLPTVRVKENGGQCARREKRPRKFTVAFPKYALFTFKWWLLYSFSCSAAGSLLESDMSSSGSLLQQYLLNESRRKASVTRSFLETSTLLCVPRCEQQLINRNNNGLLSSRPADVWQTRDETILRADTRPNEIARATWTRPELLFDILRQCSLRAERSAVPC